MLKTIIDEQIKNKILVKKYTLQEDTSEILETDATKQLVETHEYVFQITVLLISFKIIHIGNITKSFKNILSSAWMYVIFNYLKEFY